MSKEIKIITNYTTMGRFQNLEKNVLSWYILLEFVSLILLLNFVDRN